MWKHSLAEKIDEERESKDKNGCQQLEKNIVDMWKKTLKEKALKKKTKTLYSQNSIWERDDIVWKNYVYLLCDFDLKSGSEKSALSWRNFKRA